ncbi:hypothetical protein [Cellulomonas dongxiuzhuiae]|uniref:ASCH domain-containing protein n=1 Tax=Cellulomonas dongxiuzhuiae TaxID=2819979 RepID=A0ABX8GJR6_9CELL|nr:hypothetical protein [Cellulomonas dongxiuzhuiae]MBO3090052.1 hypothetical protein [Cellulomonas dongxiuzhuiae]MBO3095442.1 hypothetical protein [Cellulomonas dongxiuzhuiae]QWC16424.1 hypothetical protein KKR89_01740 [Cellulomonas dongxiuzhuiae]
MRWSAVGAGGHVARRTSAWWERLVAAREGRAPQPLVHAVLEVEVAGVVRSVDMGPTWGRTRGTRRVVLTGPVGARWLGRCPLFRYEVRVVDGSGRLPGVLAVSDDVALPGDVLDLLADVPAYTWGRDEAGAGEMWTSDSVVAWLLERSGVSSVEPPPGSRAPGWAAGARVARR